MKILVTGAKGFIGKNLIAEMRNRNYMEIMEYDVDCTEDVLGEYCRDADFIYHLAGVNRPKEACEFMTGNYYFTATLLGKLREFNNKCPIVLTSSTQADLSNPYGESKKAGEDLLFSFGQECGNTVFVYRLPNVFGKWCRPDYNSVIATFCHNIANQLPIKINDPEVLLNMVYIDDVISELIDAIDGMPHINAEGYCYVPTCYSIRLGDAAKLIKGFACTRQNNMIPDMSDGFTKKLYSTYLSYLPPEKLSVFLKMNADIRGSFTEIIQTVDRGQISLNIVKPGITKGNHWHQSKTEKFIVVSGKACIQFREVNSKEIFEYHVSGDKIAVVDIPPGYTHNLTNEGELDLITIIWSNETFDPEYPDTYYLEV
ncbi:UDP-2-acetamido-2,6-beta-L-arabino-hexul-4-ose reductase [bioreactor metagenome]|uniref:UDP-2-acetamido-2,6-beta-L-arabino-hexul-4-ose reductase n=1 Tax=bioreactor metagenome TaxID=1076179 RepID=A0A644YIU7_9ZZZZ